MARSPVLEKDIVIWSAQPIQQYLAGVRKRKALTPYRLRNTHELQGKRVGEGVGGEMGSPQSHCPPRIRGVAACPRRPASSAALVSLA
jgi:hypothetical protein